MNKSRIEWTDYTINPVKGLCPIGCSYCYARRIYKRFKLDGEIKYEPDCLNELYKLDSSDKVFVGSTMELFGDWVKEEWMEEILNVVAMCPNQTFIFLTKRPQNLIKYSPFPKNCWVGVSATDTQTMLQACVYLEDVRAKVKFLSIEPLLDWQYGWTPSYLVNALKRAKVNWLIIGQKTPSSAKTTPKTEWIQEILVAASNANNIPVFMKNNLKHSMTGAWSVWKLRQEYPNVR